MSYDVPSKWSDRLYNAAELYETFGDTLPSYLCVQEGYYGSSDEDSLLTRDKLFVYGVRNVHKFEAIVVRDNLCTSERVAIPCDYPGKVQILPLKGEHIYKSVKELVTDFPPTAKIISCGKGSGKHSKYLKAGDTIQLLHYEPGKGKDGILKCICNNQQHMDVSLALHATFVACETETLYTVNEIYEEFPLPQKIRFVQYRRQSTIPVHLRGQPPVTRGLQGLFILNRMYRQRQIMCSLIDDTGSKEAQTEVILIPTDRLGITATFQIPEQFQPAPSVDILQVVSNRENVYEDLEIVSLKASLQRIPVYEEIGPRSKAVRNAMSVYIKDDGDAKPDTPTYESLDETSTPKSQGNVFKPDMKDRPQPPEQRYVTNPKLSGESPNRLKDSTKHPKHTNAVETLAACFEDSQRLSKPRSDTLAPEVNVGTSRSPTPKHRQGKNKISSIEDIPENLESLSVDELADSLLLLKIRGPSDKMREQLVDGTMFMKLTNDILREEPFRFKPFEILQLIKFQEGWRPKLT